MEGGGDGLKDAREEGNTVTSTGTARHRGLSAQDKGTARADSQFSGAVILAKVNGVPFCSFICSLGRR